MSALFFALSLGAALAAEVSPPTAVSPAPVALARPSARDPSDDGGDWASTLDRVFRSVVSLKVTATRDFDTESASDSQGTGFVVDAERGIILTNRHMVHAGPVVAEAVFLNHEEVELEAIYRDPVHDFGFYRYDPAAIRHIDVVELPLAPDAAKVGSEIAVVGNDAGEKLSILDSRLSRLDRAAPVYGTTTYNDFNTFYMQAASNTSGGSSGSPVVDVDGNVVGLNAGGKNRAASSFYLPLQRVVRAFERIRAGEEVSRGTLQTVFSYTAYDELGRLGLLSETEAEYRAGFPDGVGLLVVSEVVPGGPADPHLQPGDVLVAIEGEPVEDFVALEAKLDGSVGDALSVRVQRGGESIDVELTVGDLHAITPAEYLDVGRGILHDLSYQMARNNKRPVQGVYVAVPGYMLSTADVSAGSLITHIDGEELTSLQDAERVLSERAQGARLRVRYQTVEDPFHSYETLALMDRRWYPMRRCVRDDSSGRWPCTDAAAPPAPEETVPASVILPPTSEKIQRAFAGALVMVDFDIPYPTAGVKDLNYIGAGTVIDAERGLILVDRDTVPVTLGDITLTFAGAVRVPGRMVYLHPIHNFAVLGYDPALLGDTPVNAVTFSDKPVRSGDRVWQVGLDADHAVVSMATRVSSIEPVELGVSRTPRYRDANIDVMVLDDAAGSLGGVVVDKRGRVLGLWASFLDQQSSERAFYGLPNTFLRPVVGPLTRGEIPSYSWIGAELAPISLATARDRGLSDDRVRAVIKHDPQGRRVFEVRRVQAQTDAALSLRDTDLVLALDGMPLTRMRELEWFYGRSQVTLTILRDGKEQEVTLGTVPVQGAGVHQVVSWAGLLIHEPHFEVEQQQGIPAPGVYIAWLWYGSPGARYGIRPTRRIIQVNGKATPDMGAFLEAVQGQADREPVRLLMEGLDGSTRVGTLKLDLQYWPTQIFAFENGEWSRSTTPGMTAQND